MTVIVCASTINALFLTRPTSNLQANMRLLVILQQIYQILQANVRFVPDSQDISHIPQVLKGSVPILHALPNIKAISHAHVSDCAIAKSCGDYKRQ